MTRATDPDTKAARLAARAQCYAFKQRIIGVISLAEWRQADGCKCRTICKRKRFTAQELRAAVKPLVEAPKPLDGEADAAEHAEAENQ